MTELYLVGFDASDCARRAVDEAARLGQRASARILLCYVIPWSPFTFSTAEENAQRHRRREDELERATRQILTPEQQRLESSNLECSIAARHGQPARTLVQLAREHEAAMIVIGANGDTPLKTRILGGTASALTQISKCPVLVVP